VRVESGYYLFLLGPKFHYVCWYYFDSSYSTTYHWTTNCWFLSFIIRLFKLYWFWNCHCHWISR